MESNLNLLAEKAGISPWEIRYRNAIRPGQVLPNGQIADRSTAMAECLLAVREAFEKAPYAGIACGFKNSGLGVGVPDAGRCTLSVQDGKIHIRSSAACIGQGVATVLIQMVCQTLSPYGIVPGCVIAEPPDTARTPNSGTTTASRQTLFSGEAAVLAAKQLVAALEAAQAAQMAQMAQTAGKSADEALRTLEGMEYYGEYKPETDPMGSEKPFPVSHVAYGYAAQVAELDGQGKLKRVTAAYDVGTVVNPKSAQGQIEGGIVMGIGYALTEDYPLVEGYPQARYATLGLTRATDAPEIETILIERGERNDEAYGAKGVGELATIPTAPAIHGAFYSLDGKFRKKLPMEGTTG